MHDFWCYYWESSHKPSQSNIIIWSKDYNFPFASGFFINERVVTYLLRLHRKITHCHQLQQFNKKSPAKKVKILGTCSAEIELVACAWHIVPCRTGVEISNWRRTTVTTTSSAPPWSPWCDRGDEDAFCNSEMNELDWTKIIKRQSQSITHLREATVTWTCAMLPSLRNTATLEQSTYIP